MSDEKGKTEEQEIEELRQKVLDSFSPEAPESDPSEAPAEKPADQDGEPEPLAAEPTPAPEKKEEPAPEQDLVPTKYKGKSQEDLLKILQDQDSYIGKLGSERSHEKSEAEKLREELSAIRQDFASKQEQDEEVSLKQGLEDDPAKAVIDYIDQKLGSVDKKFEQNEKDHKLREAQVFYDELLTNPDFVRRQEQVNKVADALQQYVKPEYQKSKDFVNICDVISRGLDVDYYIQQSKVESASKKEADLKEKRDAQVATGSSSGQSAEASPSEMTLDDLKERAVAAFMKKGN